METDTTHRTDAAPAGRTRSLVAITTLSALPVIVFVRGRWRHGWALAQARV